MGNEKESQTAILERANEREQGLINQVENLRWENGEVGNSQSTLSGTFELPNPQVQLPPLQALTIPQIYDEEKNGDVDKSKTWKDTTDKRKQDKDGKKK